MTKAIPRSLARIWQPCVFLATLVKVNPVGVEPGPAGRSKEDTAVLQSAATSDKLDRRIDPEFLHRIAYNR